VELKNKIAIVTGGGSGIGRALVAKFMAEGAAQVVAVDINAENAQQTADQNGCVAMHADVANEADITRVINDVESDIGPVDLFCSNAGLGAGASEQSPDAEWQISWDVNVMSQVYAARHMVPRMIERGGGYLLNTASAAGLLNQIGGAAYGVTKHASVGLAEWLSMSYAHQGIKVSVLCPQAVRTPMTEQAPDSEMVKAAAGDGMMEPEQVADIVVDHLQREQFLILTHPEVEQYMQAKTGDYQRWIDGMNRLHCRLTNELN
jgi:NAD(P)-dependent dehydrogenase (short-subunit alcohol dehydrogenase family)